MRNPPYSHAICITLARPGTHEIPPSVTGHNKLALLMWKKGSDFAWGPCRRVGSKPEERHRVITANYLDGVISPPMPYGASSWKGPTVLLWHLLLPRTKHYVEIIWRLVALYLPNVSFAFSEIKRSYCRFSLWKSFIISSRKRSQIF